jgi:FkbM family methyltransferase
MKSVGCLSPRIGVETEVRMIDLKKRARLFRTWALSKDAVCAALRPLCQRRLIPERLWMRFPVERTFEVWMGSRKLFDYSSTTSDAMGRGLFWGGLRTWEPETVSTFMKLAESARVVLDVGANTGLYTLLACAANHSSRVIAFEPVPELRERLSAEIYLNGWMNRCSIRSEAVSSQPGRSMLYVPRGRDLSTIASLNPKGFEEVECEVLEVSQATVDDVCGDVDKVDLVKIDVEGLEDKVLEGMKNTLASSRPSIILECNVGGPATAIQEQLGALGYRFCHLRNEGPVPVDSIEPDKDGVYRNFLCTVGSGP